KESNLYYLNSRYYSPIYYRFISIDDIDYLKSESINGINLYTYCRNDPINYTDQSGHAPTKWWEWVLAGLVVTGLTIGAILTGGTLIGAVFAGAALGAGMSLGSQAISGELNWGQFALDIGVGAITGLIGGSGISKGVATVLSGVVGAGSNLASQLISGVDLKNVSIMQIILAGAMGVVSGLIGGAGARNKEAISSGKNVQKATKQLNKVIRRIANGYRYNATTAQVAFTNAMNELTSAISLQIGQMFTKAMVVYGLSTIIFSTIDAICDNFDLWFF
ncbi:MAG: RHS repeat-associated core domain-containing protein, partial [Candidatus Caccosoma sp.]|nr:RHS repeat-associated core domain-containing protein [Candidatus Caccosoma sp.]